LEPADKSPLSVRPADARNDDRRGRAGGGRRPDWAHAGGRAAALRPQRAPDRPGRDAAAGPLARAGRPRAHAGAVRADRAGRQGAGAGHVCGGAHRVGGPQCCPCKPLHGALCERSRTAARRLRCTLILAFWDKAGRWAREQLGQRRRDTCAAQPASHLWGRRGGRHGSTESAFT